MLSIPVKHSLKMYYSLNNPGMNLQMWPEHTHLCMYVYITNTGSGQS